jgi:hypothetical protein
MRNDAKKPRPKNQAQCSAAPGRILGLEEDRLTNVSLDASQRALPWAQLTQHVANIHIEQLKDLAALCLIKRATTSISLADHDREANDGGGGQVQVLVARHILVLMQVEAHQPATLIEALVQRTAKPMETVLKRGGRDHLVQLRFQQGLFRRLSKRGEKVAQMSPYRQPAEERAETCDGNRGRIK